MSGVARTITEAVKEGLSLWKTFIETRQEAYNRKKDKEQEKAIGYAEESFMVADKYFNYVFSKVKLSEEDEKELGKIKSKYYKLKSKFNKYD